MSHAVIGRDVGPGGYRQGASGCRKAVAGYYKGSVMKRGVLEEKVHYQTTVDGGIDVVAGRDDVVKRYRMSDDDKRAGLVF